MSTSCISGTILFRCAADRAPVSMCRLILLLTIAYIQVKASSESPPRVASCRIIYKSKEDDIYTIPAAWGACEKFLSFKISNEKVTNLTDTRNCENFYQCQGYSCHQCPCPIGQTFNPKTLMCDDSQSECACPHPDTSPATTLPSSTSISQKPSTTPEAAGSNSTTLIPHSRNDQLTSMADGKKKEPNAEVIIIAAVVSATVIVIVVIAMALFLWQKNRRHRRPVEKISPVRPDGYLSAGPPSERHIYAEIDENMISRKHWQHGTSQRPPALPDHLPPSKPNSPFPNHSHSDSGVGSVDNSYTEGYSSRHCSHGHFSDSSSPRYVKDHHVTSPSCHREIYHTTGGSSISSESQYSTTSQLTSLDSHDMRQPLHHSCRQNYMSQQVYI